MNSARVVLRSSFFIHSFCPLSGAKRFNLKAHFCFKVFDPNFFQKVWRGCVGWNPHGHGLSFWSFFFGLLPQRKSG
jgi:hypothetical protein